MSGIDTCLLVGLQPVVENLSGTCAIRLDKKKPTARLLLTHRIAPIPGGKEEIAHHTSHARAVS